MVITMRIERISYNKIKVTLSVNDLERWNVTADNLSYNSPQAQEMFWDMMRKAEDETGFIVHDSKLVIEATPSKSGGFIIFVTRLEGDDELESLQKFIKSRFRKSELRVKKKNKRPDPLFAIYIFNDFEDVRLASSRIQSMYTENSSLYKYKNCYYLMLFSDKVLDEVNVNGVENVEILCTILSDYGARALNHSITEGLLNEYGELIIKNIAIETLNKHFS
jgi:adapter protein MecA 1/2